ncbi:MAG TPA: FMN-binding protein [Phycisphaerae bacterium]|nr:FMN-binding protein [Phycisphaerae bacterium]
MRPNLKSPPYVIAYAGLMAALFTAAIMTLHVATEPVVRRNKELFKQRAYVELFALGDPKTMTPAQVAEVVRKRIVERTEPLVDPQTGEQIQLVEAYGQDGKLVGYAIPIWGVGFWARIDGLLAVSPDLTRTMGVVFLSHSETPGLGGRITEDDFRRQFRQGKDITPSRAGGPFLTISPEKIAAGDPRYARHVDAITGATGTSTALDKFLNERLRRFRRAATAAGMIAPGPAPGAGDPLDRRQ